MVAARDIVVKGRYTRGRIGSFKDPSARAFDDDRRTAKDGGFRIWRDELSHFIGRPPLQRVHVRAAEAEGEEARRRPA